MADFEASVSGKYVYHSLRNDEAHSGLIFPPYKSRKRKPMDYGGAMGTDTLLVADAETAEFRKGGPAIAGIWLVTESTAFPQAGWSDFVVGLLCWWADALLKILRNEGTQARVNFMDGPYYVAVARSFGTLKFRMIARDREVGTGEAAVKPFVVGLASQSRRVLDACRSQEWWSTDADALELLLEKLELEIGRP